MQRWYQGRVHIDGADGMKKELEGVNKGVGGINKVRGGVSKVRIGEIRRGRDKKIRSVFHKKLPIAFCES